MQISLLGGVRATTDGGEPLDVGPPRCQAVLAALALSAGSAVPVPLLIERVWGGEPPRTAEKTLQWYVAQLRRSLGAEAIERVGAAYRLEVVADAVDVGRFLRHLETGDVDAALREWSGPPLAALDAGGMAPAVDGLVERWLDATERSLTRRVETDPAGAVGQLTELTAQHPFREGFWALLMTALYRSGRQSEALTTFQTARRLLLEEVGVEPGVWLRETEALVLAGRDVLPDAPGMAGSPPASLAPAAGGLPAPLGRLIGREADLAIVADALATSRLVSLVGPGGIGKTRLALAAAWATVGDADDVTAPGPTVFVDLAQGTSSAEVPRIVADALGVREHGGSSPTAAIVTALRTRAALLLIDNCEHVIDGAAELVEAIAERCPRVRVLATSREPLAVGGELLVTLGPLDTDAAVELFAQRVRAAGGAHVPGANLEVAELCRRLDGVPLAIELAAARASTMTPAELIARFDDSLRLLTGGRRTSGGRQRTLRAAIGWSMDLLGEHERMLLQRLSVFTGPFPLQAAEAVGADDHDEDEHRHAAALLARLVDQSMVLVTPEPPIRGPGPGRSFRLLETVRQFAREELVSTGAEDTVAARHARWCGDEVAAIGALLSGPAEADGVARLAHLWPNLRAAVGWAFDAGDDESALALIRPIVTEIALRGRHELGDWVEGVVAISGGDADGTSWGLLWASQRYVQGGDPGAYRRVAARLGEPDHPLARYARAYADGRADDLAACAPSAVAWARAQDGALVADLLELGTSGILLGAGRFADVDATVSTLVERQRRAGRPTLLHWGLSALAYSAALQGDSDLADRLYDEAADTDLPPSTLSANKPIQARGVFRRGEQRRGLRILRDAVDDVLITGNLVAASVIAVEFVNMMGTLGRPAHADALAAYLEDSNAFGERAAVSLVHEPARRRASGSAARRVTPANDREALEAMRTVLDELA